MAQVFMYLQNNYVWVLFSIIIIQLLIILFFLSQWYTLRQIQKNQRALFKGMDNNNLEEILNHHLQRSEQVVKQMEVMEKQNREIRADLNNCIQKVGVVRFSAFDNIGSDLSFSTALLDNKGDGLVISSLYGREESRTYAKPIKEGKSTYQLSEEEIKALQLAKEEK